MQDVLKWIAAVPSLVGFGLALGLNPALYGATADILARGRSVRPSLTMLLSGLVAGATVLVLVLHGANPANLVSGVRERGDAVIENDLIDLIVAVILLLAASAMLLWVRRVPEPPRKPRRETDVSTPPASLFVLGFSSAIIGFTTLPIMYLTGRLVVSISSDIVLRLVAYAVFLVALVAPFVLLAWIWSRFPTASGKVTELYGRILAWDFRWVAFVVMLLCAIALLIFTLFFHR